MTEAEALLIRMVEAEEKAPHATAYMPMRLGSQHVLFHPGWATDEIGGPPMSTTQPLLNQLFVRGYIRLRGYLVTEKGLNRYTQLTGRVAAVEAASDSP